MRATAVGPPANGVTVRIEPMKAASGDLPNGAEWSYEIKWDGIRIVAQIPEAARSPEVAQIPEAARSPATAQTSAAEGVRLWSTTGIDRSPEFGAIRDQLPIAAQGQACVLDGEVVALDARGRADFRMLQRHRTDGHVTVYVVFDLLELHGRDTRDLPLAARLRLLDALLVDTESVWQSERSLDGVALLDTARRQQHEGIMAKRLTSSYRSGRRSPDWRKVKVRYRQELVVIGWTEGQGARAGRVGALLVGTFAEGHWRTHGKIGTGFNDAEAQAMLARFRPLTDVPAPKGWSGRAAATVVHLVEPTEVIEVEFAGWTDHPGGTIRHGAFKGFRDDKDPASVAIDEVQS
jgi:bifunctional non-homologous end joining protein LigD